MIWFPCWTQKINTIVFDFVLLFVCTYTWNFDWWTDFMELHILLAIFVPEWIGDWMMISKMDCIMFDFFFCIGHCVLQVFKVTIFKLCKLWWKCIWIEELVIYWHWMLIQYCIYWKNNRKNTYTYKKMNSSLILQFIMKRKQIWHISFDFTERTN